MWKRFLYWLKPKKTCKCCCMHCKYYKECISDYERIDNAK